MNKEYYLNKIENYDELTKNILLKQINNYFKFKEYKISKHNYAIGDDVFLKKGTLLHGTFKNIDGLKEILNDGLIASWFINDEKVTSKYPASVGVWNLKKDYLLKDYIDFYSGGTIRYNNMHDDKTATAVISYTEMPKLMEIIKNMGFQRWKMEQTKEARFMPSLIQDNVQIGIIFDGNNDYIKELLKYDILNPEFKDEEAKEFINPYYYERFIVERKDKDDFFTNRESAILFGIPANFIEGILVGRDYEKNKNILNEIKELLPNCYICNLDGKVVLN